MLFTRLKNKVKVIDADSDHVGNHYENAKNSKKYEMMITYELQMKSLAILFDLIRQQAISKLEE